MDFRWTRVLLSFLLASMAAWASAQDYPARAIRLINPGTPGGSTDPVARLVGQRLSEILGRPVVVESHPGAASSIGTEVVTRAPPDGYTLLLAPSSISINPALYPKLAYDARRDLAPIAMLAQTPNMLAVHSSVPVQNVKELIAYAKANPGKLNYGSAGNGATNHLAMELFKSMAGVNLVHVPYKAGGALITDFLGGQVQVTFTPPSNLLQHFASGKIRPIAIGSLNRMPGLDLPSVSESGLPGFEATVWFALFTTAGTPQPVIARLNREVNRILKEPAIAEKLLQGGYVPVGGTPEELGAILRNDTARWAKVVKDAGMKID